jgi:hypothetical protein
MQLKNIVVYAVIITGFCLGYVQQQVTVIKLSYILRDKEKKVSELIDRNKILSYNNMSLMAPEYLSGMLKYYEMNMGLPDTTAVATVRIVRKQPQLARAQWRSHSVDVFVPKAQAAVVIKK